MPPKIPPQVTTEYERPKLSVYFENLGRIFILLSIVAIIYCLYGEKPLLAIIVGLSGFLTVFLYFGMAQVIDFLGRTAYNSERLCNLMNSSIVSQMTATKELKAIKVRLFLARPFNARVDDIAKASPTDSMIYHYTVYGHQEGPFTAENLKRLHSVGVLEDNSPVFKEGDSEWRTFIQFADLAR